MTVTLQQAKAYAWRRLATKSQPTIELIEAMRKKGYPDTLIMSVVEECKALGYLDDNQWIEGYIKRELERNRSIKIVAHKLKLKGIESSLIQKHLKNVSKSDTEALKCLIEQKYHRYDLKDPKQKQKVCAALFRRGFDYDSISNALNNSR